MVAAIDLFQPKHIFSIFHQHGFGTDWAAAPSKPLDHVTQAEWRYAFFFLGSCFLRHPAGGILSMCKAPEDSDGLENATGSTDGVTLKT